MKKGQSINGYRILQDFTTAGGGQSKWTFAAKGGKEYFMKEFLAPKYPTEDGLGSEETKRNLRQSCEAFEQHHRALIDKLSSRAADGGNLLVTLDFFRAGTTYYKITDKVDTKGLTPAKIADAAPERKALILLTVAHSLRIIHQSGVVHGDLKPDNILIKESAKGSFVAKMIDFDNSYLTGKPPADKDETVGDPVYYSPEMLRYVKQLDGAQPSHLQLASDIFALGLIYTQFLTGRLPSFDETKFQYACEAVNAGSPLTLPMATTPLGGLIERMLHAQWDKRPSIDEVFTTLKSRGDRPAEPATPTIASGTLRGTLLKKPVTPTIGKEARADEKAPPVVEKTRLSGTLFRRKP